MGTGGQVSAVEIWRKGGERLGLVLRCGFPWPAPGRGVLVVPGSCSRCCPGAACTGGGIASRRGGRPQASAVPAGCGPAGNACSRLPCRGVRAVV